MLKRLALRWRPRPGGRVRWGNLRRTQPFSDTFGWDRGVPVDRFYIGRFLRSHAERIRGDALEVRDSVYLRRFGGERVTSIDIVDIDPGNAEATLIADLAEEGSLPQRTYDAIVVTQTFQYVRDDLATLRNLYAALRPGGTLLLTVPCVQRICNEAPDADRWRFTPRGLEDRIRSACPEAVFEVRGHGNALAGVAALMGVAKEELPERQLALDDPAFPIVVSAVVTRPE